MDNTLKLSKDGKTLIEVYDKITVLGAKKVKFCVLN